MNVCTSSEMLAILLSVKNTCLAIVYGWVQNVFPEVQTLIIKC